MNPAFKSMAERPFYELESVGSTNNYAMAAVHDGTAKTGETWFAHHQSAGRGQRGRTWMSVPGENILMSLVWQPGLLLPAQQFILSAMVSMACIRWLETVSVSGWWVKWPNDLYWNDRKAAGILIENSVQGVQWRFAVIGVGVNLNQLGFPPELPGAVSLRQITGKTYSPVDMARQLSAEILDSLAQPPDPATALRGYNERLYRRDETISFKKPDGEVFQSTVLGVDEKGWLQTENGIIKHGEVEWLR